MEICITQLPQGEGLELVSTTKNGNIHKITTSVRRIGISIDYEKWKYEYNDHLREKDWN
jgi:hypothetical protein